MSHQIIQAALAATFVAVWAAIAWTIVGDGLSEVRRRRSTPRGPHFAGKRPTDPLKQHAGSGQPGA